MTVTLNRHRRKTLQTPGRLWEASQIVLTTLGLTILAPVAQAQEQAPATEIIVTGSRIAKAGFNAPTPTSVIGKDLIQAKGQTSTTEILNSLPSVRASASIANATPAQRAGSQNVDLRGLGTVRTLLLIDSQRAVPTTQTGVSDLSLIPSLMIDRVEVVTGGASAGYGSDAVAGVVNLILKKRMKGIEGEVFKGITSYGDRAETKLGLMAGTDYAQGRGHFVIGGEYHKIGEIYDARSRPWGQNAYAIYSNPCAGVAGTAIAASLGCPGNVANGQPQRIIAPNVYFSNYTQGGLITAVGGGTPASLRGTGFGTGGTPYSFPFGSLTTTSQTLTNGAINALNLADNIALSQPIERYNVMARTEFEVSDRLKLWASALYAASSNTTRSFPQRSLPLTIRGDNGFLRTVPALASIAAQIPALSTNTFSLGREWDDIGPSGFATSSGKNETYNIVGGLNGKIGKTWSWEVTAQTGRNVYNQSSPYQLVRSRFNNAVDSVVAGGQVVCRINADAISTNDDPGCVAINPFGSGSPSAAATAYATSTATFRQVVSQTTVNGLLRGDLLQLPAGTLSVAAGAEYRTTSVNQTVDAISAANGFINNTTNQQPLAGSYNVKEVFGEVQAPVFKNSILGAGLDLNGAVRRTDYSTSGPVTTWKVSGVYRLIDGISFRATRSRDIRAPNISELFSGAVGGNPSGLSNPFLGGTGIGLGVTSVTSGNPALKPEVANTETVGLVLKPRLIPGLAFSVDYFNIDVRGVISTQTSQNIINGCYTGNQALCGLLTFGSDGKTITNIAIKQLNLSRWAFRGLDFELSYGFDLGGGRVTLSALASKTIHTIIDDAINGPIDYAGAIDGGAVGTYGLSRPKWNGSLYMGYRKGPVGVGAEVRYIGEGVYSVLAVEGVSATPRPGIGFTINNNHVPAVAYLNLNASVDVVNDGRRKLQFFGVVNNVFDKAPPLFPVSASPTNPTIYDTAGRALRVGVRFKY
ncbi:TonB-dependent receptor plug domain-containing protein [Novosphingobium sediminicola]|uniref:TonB-dependent receptor plug domain-containing protein n=1 Tax=Novosphingobium sediminicola TaxID=563162 RepID=UPI0016209C2A|nr:TonB-dependent receptor [Novosphingobium sediminicola]